MKEEICRAFCSELHVEEVPAGLAVTAGFRGVTGENILFYVMQDKISGAWRIQDDGTNVPYIEASGADLNNGARASTFNELLSEYKADFDDETQEIYSSVSERKDLPAACLRFIALLVRVQELLLTTPEKAKAYWVDEALEKLRATAGPLARVDTDEVISAELSDWPADVVVRAAHRAPVALFFGVSNNKAYEALLLHSMAKYQFKIPCIVVLLLEDEKALTKRIRQRADNSIIVPKYRGAEHDAIGRIVEEAVGERPRVH